VQQGLIEARAHFDAWGKAEGRAASYLFNPDEYLATYQDVAKAVAEGWMNVYQHFETYGSLEGRTPFQGFDVDHYLAVNADVAQAVAEGWMTAVHHFMQYGYNEIRNFNPDFDIVAYLDANPGATAAVQAGQVSAAELMIQQYSTAFGWADAAGDFGDSDDAGGSGDSTGDGGSGDNGGIIVPGLDPDLDLDLGEIDLDAIFQQLEEMLVMMGGAIDVERIQNLVLESGLLDPANLNPDGSGLKDPMPLVELLWDEFYGVNPFDIIGGMPDMSGFPGMPV